MAGYHSNCNEMLAKDQIAMTLLKFRLHKAFISLGGFEDSQRKHCSNGLMLGLVTSVLDTAL